MKLTEKMKKNLAILGGVLIGIGLIAAIGMQFGPKPSGEDVLPGTGETETELIVDPGDFEKKEEESKVVSREEESLVIHPGIGENQETDTQAVDSRSPQTDQTTQSIQPKPTKPEPVSYTHLDVYKRQGYVDTAIKILIAVVLGALLLAGLYALFNDTVLPTLVRRVQEMFDYSG